jgi:hypothetical protein
LAQCAGGPGNEGNGHTDEAGQREHQGDASLGADAEPAADQVGAEAVGHRRHEHGLSEGRHQERRQGRRRVLHELGEPEDPALTLERDRPLQHGLLAGLDDRDQCQPDDHPDREHDDRRAQGEHRADRPGREIGGEDEPERIASDSATGNDDATADEGQHDEGEEQAPGLDGHERQAVAVHQGHEHTGEEVVERGQEQQREQPGHGADRLERAPHIHHGLGVAGDRLGSGLGESDRGEVDERCRHQRQGDQVRPAHAKTADGEAAEDRCQGERHARHRAHHPVGAVPAIFGNQQRDARGQCDPSQLTGDGPDQGGGDEDPEPDVGQAKELARVRAGIHDGGDREAQRRHRRRRHDGGVLAMPVHEGAEHRAEQGR